MIQFLSNLMQLMEDLTMFRFDREKTTESIIHLSDKVDQATVMKLVAILYLGDKLHLQSYGRTITGDQYVGNTLGVYPKNTYNMLMEGVIGSFIQSDGVVVPMRAIERGKFSGTDIQTLNTLVEKYNGLSAQELQDMTKDAAWVQSVGGDYDETKGDVFIDMFDIVNTLDDAKRIFDYLGEMGIICTCSSQ